MRIHFDKFINNAILKFTGDSEPNTQANSILSAQSSLKLVSNTIVNNAGFTTFLYDSIGSKSLSYNIDDFYFYSEKRNV